VFTEPLNSNGRGADSIENSFPSIVASIRVYEAVAWQRFDQIRYIISSLNFKLLVEQC
jgi:hypothetical protein